MQPQVAWVSTATGSRKRELAAAFPDAGAAKLDRLLGDLSRMALVGACTDGLQMTVAKARQAVWNARASHRR